MNKGQKDKVQVNRPASTPPMPPSDSAITPKRYWDEWWKGKAREPSFKHWSLDPMISGFDRFLLQNKNLQPLSGGRLLEIGCGGSNWLSYFAQRWDCQVEGIDYSEEGCWLTQKILSRDHVEGKIHQNDFFRPPTRLLGSFDTVFSAGVLEHFVDTASCLKAFQSFLKPSGCLITVIPNLCGVMGELIRFLTPKIHSMHVPVSREGLVRTLQNENTRILWCDYLLPFNLGVVDLSPIRPYFMQKTVADIGNLLSRGIGWFAYRIGRPLTSRKLSPYLLAVTQHH